MRDALGVSRMGVPMRERLLAAIKLARQGRHTTALDEHRTVRGLARQVRDLSARPAQPSPRLSGQGCA